MRKFKKKFYEKLKKHEDEVWEILSFENIFETVSNHFVEVVKKCLWNFKTISDFPEEIFKKLLGNLRNVWETFAKNLRISWKIFVKLWAKYGKFLGNFMLNLSVENFWKIFCLFYTNWKTPRSMFWKNSTFFSTWFSRNVNFKKL